jgi:hypothetical protein
MMGLRFVSGDYDFVEPVFTTETHVLSAGTPPQYFTSFINYRRGIDFVALRTFNQGSSGDRTPAAMGHDFGGLLALMLARGNAPAHAASMERPQPGSPPGTPPSPPADPTDTAAMAAHEAEMRQFDADMHNWYAYMWGIQHAMIPEVQMNMDRIVISVVTMLNDAVMGRLRAEDGSYIFDTNPTDMSDPPREGIPMFVRNMDINAPGDAPWPFTADPHILGTRLTLVNMQVNPELFGPGGHNRMALSITGAQGDTQLLNEIQQVWMSNAGPYSIQIGGRNFNVQDAYINMTGDLSRRIAEANTFVSAKTIMTIQADNQRHAVKGVSMDEELNSMLRFQHAFQASSRVFNVIDSMIDQIVNGTGRVGR